MKLFFLLTALLLWSVSLGAYSQSPEGDIITMGDSLTAGLAGSSGGVITCAALGGAVIAADQQGTCKGNGQKNIGGWQPALAAQTMVDVFNYGNSGELTSQILNRLNATMAVRPSQFVLILGGTNDAIRGPAVSTVISNLETMVARVKAAGRIPVIATLPPLLGGRFAANNNKVLSINAEISAMQDIEVADLYDALVGNWSSNTSGDFIHLGNTGNAVVAEQWADAISRSLTIPEPEPVVTPKPVIVPVLGLFL